MFLTLFLCKWTLALDEMLQFKFISLEDLTIFLQVIQNAVISGLTFQANGNSAAFNVTFNLMNTLQFISVINAEALYYESQN